MIKFKEIENGVTAPLGFKASGVACGIKQKGGEDLAVIYSEIDALTAGMFTTNKFKGAAVIVDLKYLKNGNNFRAVVVNSGNANACTGEEGIKDAEEMTALTAENLGIKKEEVLVSSTGIIGKKLPMDKVKNGIIEAVEKLSYTGGGIAAKAIMTTDTKLKEFSIDTGIMEEATKQLKSAVLQKASV